MQGRPALGPVVAPPESFAVNGHHLALGQFAYLGHHGGEAITELLRVQETEDTPKCVLERNAIGQLQEPGEPIALGLTELLYLNPIVGAANHGA